MPTNMIIGFKEKHILPCSNIGICSYSFRPRGPSPALHKRYASRFPRHQTNVLPPAVPEGRLTFCGKQSCFAPNKCLPFLGVDVCVRTPSPTCAKTLCPEGYECALLQDLCRSRPCYPKPYCVKKSKLAEQHQLLGQ